MVWREKGKYGFHTSGRTLRADLSNSYGSSFNSAEGIVVKQVRNVALLSTNGAEDFIYENDFDDGIGTLKNLVVSEDLRGRSRARFARGEEVQYSLGKRKRWLIPEMVKTHSLDEICTEGEKPIGKITLVERRVHASEAQRGKGDCETVYDSRTETVREPRHRFAHVGDLEPKTQDPCVRYEICRAYPESSWPRNVGNRCGGCRCCDNYRNPNKSASKNKHFKNKEYRWGHFREHDLVHAKNDPDVTRCGGVRAKRPRKQDINGAGKVRVVSVRDLIKPTKDSSNNNCAVFDIGGYIDALLRDKASCDTAVPQATQNKCTAEILAPRKIFIPEATEIGVNPMVYSESVVPVPKLILAPEKKLTTQLEIIRSDIEPEQLTQSWGESYREGMSHPRKFTIDFTTLISSCHGNTSVLFEQQEGAVNNSDVVSTSVSLIAVSDTMTDSNKPFTDASVEFARNLETISKDNILFNVKDIIDVAGLAVDKYVAKENTQQKSDTSCKKPRTGIKAFEMLNKALGWEMMPTTAAEAMLEIKQNCTFSNAVDMCSATNKEPCCGICFMNFDYDDCDQALPFTSLKTCGHSFCNECWEIYLKIQLYEGRVPVMCPGHECKGAVDDVTIMSLIPSFYGRYIRQSLNKALETSPKWMWCPANSCRLVVRVNNARTGRQTEGSVLTHSSMSEEPLAVPCACGTTSCRLCQQEAHWPASCVQARQFQCISKAYEAVLKEEGKDLITSVQVRKCPNCRYPIEKHMGCNFMYCIMCNTSYCWNCLVVMEKHGATYSCKSPPKQSEEVSIPVDFLPDKFNAVINVAIKNRIARSGSEMTRFRQAVNNIQRILSAPTAQLPLPSRRLRRKGLTSVASKLRERSSMTSRELVTSLQSLADFKYMCHFVLEGTAKVICLPQNHHNKRRLRFWMFQLQFVTDQISRLITGRGKKLWLEPGAGAKLQNWCRNGRNCIYAIRKLTQS